MRDVALNGMIYFEAVARLSRVTLAAEELSVSSSAVSQQIKSLEEMLGVRLFRRVKRRLILTEEGERLYLSTNEALRILREARRQLVASHDTCQLTIRVAASFGVHWLGPRVTRFVAQNPTWDLHVDATPEITEFEKEHVDLDIRYGRAGWSGLHVEAIVHDEVLPLCSPAYRDEITAQSRDPEDSLREARLLHTVKSLLSWNWWLGNNRIGGVDPERGLKFDRSSMSLRAAKDNAGVVLESATLAMDDLVSGALVPLLPKRGTVRFPAYWIVCPRRHLNLRYVSAFCEWLRNEAREHEKAKNELLAALNCDRAHDLEF